MLEEYNNVSLDPSITSDKTFYAVYKGNYLTFTAREECSVKFSNNGSYSLEYRTDSMGNFASYTKGQSIVLAEGSSIYFRGDNRAFSSQTDRVRFSSTGYIEASGSVMSLMTDTSLDHPYQFASLFEGCIYLLTPPVLGSINLTEGCYASMFEGCTSLTKAPELPGKHIQEYSYSRMFRNCKQLETSPVINPQSIQGFALDQMFYGCSKLNYVICLGS